MSERWVFSLGALLFYLATPVFAQELLDATGTQVKLADHPIRVVTLIPSLGELAADLSDNHFEKIVGVSDFTDYPPRLEKVPSVGPYTRFNLEKVVALKPDLVLASLEGNPKDQVLHLRELGLPVVVVGSQTFAQIENSIKLVAAAMGVPTEGQEMATRFARGLARLRAAGAQHLGKSSRVLLQVGDEPLIVAGGASFLSEALSTVGAVNLYADAKAGYPRPAVEDVVHRSPDVILVLALGHDLASFNPMAQKWMQFTTIRAVQMRQVRVLQGDAVLRPTLRLLEGLSLLERAVYGKK